MEENNHINEVNKMMFEQLEILHAESKKEETTADEKVELSKAMAVIYKTVVE